MLKFVQKKLKEEKGLTLIELLAVIVILAIVAAIAIPAIGNIIENSRHGAVKADFQNAIAAANLYKTENGALPEAAADGSTTALEELSSYLDDKGSLTLVAFGTNGDGEITISGEATATNDDEYKITTAVTNNELSNLSNEEFGDYKQ